MGQFHIEKGVLIKYRGKDKHVVVPDGVREIGREAFKHCQTMESISLPAGLAFIGEYAFEECKQLTEITLPDGVMIIGSAAFEECISLKKIHIPNSVRVIGAYAFSECGNLQELVIPVGVKLVQDLLNLSDIAGEIYCEATKRPHGWEEHWLWDYYPMDDDEESEEDLSDDPYAVWGYNNIITHPDFDYVIHGGKAYLTRYKGEGGHVVIPSSIEGYEVVSFGEIFSEDSSITSITIPDTITEIENYAFYQCGALTSVTIGRGVLVIGESVFEGCPHIQEFIVAAGNPIYHSEGNCIIETATRMLCHACLHSELPKGLAGVYKDAFSCCERYKDIPDWMWE